MIDEVDLVCAFIRPLQKDRIARDTGYSVFLGKLWAIGISNKRLMVVIFNPLGVIVSAFEFLEVACSFLPVHVACEVYEVSAKWTSGDEDLPSNDRFPAFIPGVPSVLTGTASGYISFVRDSLQRWAH